MPLHTSEIEKPVSQLSQIRTTTVGCVHAVVFSLIPSPPQLSSPGAHVATHPHPHVHTPRVNSSGFFFLEM